MINKQKKNILMIFALLGTIVLYYFYAFKKYDLSPSDDDVYLSTALRLKIPFEKFGHFLYPLFMRFFSFFSSNNINLIYNYHFFISCLLFLSFFLYLKYSKINIYISYFLSVTFLFSSFQIYLSPRLTLMNLIIGFIFLSIISTKTERYVKWGLMSICLLLCNYVNINEFLPFFILSFIIFLYKTFTHSNLSFVQKIQPTFLILALLGTLYAITGGIQNPSVFVNEYKYHFLDNWEHWTGEHYDFQDELNVFERVYGKANSLFDFITVNPKLFLKHTLNNFLNYILIVLQIFKSSFYQPFVSAFGPLTKYVILGILGFLAISINYKATLSTLKSQFKSLKQNLTFLEIFSLPGLGIAILVFPRNHYTILDLPIYFLLIGLIGQSVILKNISIWNYLRWGILFVFIAGVWIQKPILPENGHTQYYKYMYEASLKKPLKILSNDFFGHNYFSGHSNIQNYDPYKNELNTLLDTQTFDVLTIYGMDLELPSNREFIKSGYKTSNYVRVRDFEKANRYVFVRPDNVRYFGR